MKTGKFVLRFVLVVVAFLLPAVVSAQTSNGAVAGTVMDQSGAVVPKANVKVESAVLSVTRETSTEAGGGYRIESLPPGTYSISFTAAGFDVYQVNDVLVAGGFTTTVNAKLTLGQVKHTVVVEAQAGSQIDTQSGQMGTNLSTEEVLELPQNSLNPAELALTLPGVQDGNGYGFSNGFNFSVNGSRPRANNFLIDGQDDNDNAIAGQAFQPTNIGAVQEVSILTNSFSAEYGRGGGSVTNYIYNSGSNQFHGKAWELVHTSDVDAVDAASAFLDETKPVSIENIFGFSFGGPIVHDKLFVFGTAQWDRFRTTANGTGLRIPTDAGIATLQSVLPMLTPAGQANVNYLLASFGSLRGDPNVSPSSVDLGAGRGLVATGLTARTGVSEASNDRQWDVRMDYHVNTNDVLYGAYLRDDSALTPDFFNFSNAYPGFDSQQGGPSQVFRGGWTHTLSSNVVNELRFSYTNIAFTFAPTPQTAANPLSADHNVSFGSDTGFTTLGLNGALPQGRAHKTWQIQEALSYSFGRHTFKGGIDTTFLSVTDAIPFNYRGSISYLKGGGFSSLGNFIDDFTGQGGSISVVFGNPVIHPNVTMYMPYIEDTYRVKDNLTLTFGLRYEYWGTVENSVQYPAYNAKLGFGVVGGTFPGAYSSLQQGDRNNFAPRFGFAYTPHWGGWLTGHDKTVIRGGYGIFYDGMFTNILDNTAASSPNTNGGTITGGTGRGAADATATLAGFTPVPNPFATSNTINNNLRNPLTHQWNLQIQRELPGRFIFSAAYVGSRGEHLFVNQDFNETVDFGPRLNPGFGSVVSRTNGADSNYHSGQFELERRFHTSLTIRASYTYSKLIDDGSEVFSTTGGASRAQNLECQKCDYGLSAYDRRHRFVAAYIWQIPGVKSSSFMRLLTDGYEVAGIITAQTGAPNTIFDGFDVNGDGNAGNDRPNVGNASLPVTSRGIDGTQLGLNATPGTYYDINPCLNAAVPVCIPQSASSFHWLIPASGLGSVGRNTYIGPGQFFWNSAVQKTFKLPMGRLENQAIIFRVDAFNILNHPNLVTPDLSQNSSTDLLDPDFADPKSTITGGRTMRFSLMYQF
jgi:outer membrane receptor protein involved in Fe transport